MNLFIPVEQFYIVDYKGKPYIEYNSLVVNGIKDSNMYISSHGG